jgi:uncharacterized protein YjiS (DUF1127 family)
MDLHREHNESDSAFERIASWISARWRRSQTLRELSELDDRMLADIGLNRYDIPAAAAGDVSRGDSFGVHATSFAGAPANRNARAA